MQSNSLPKRGESGKFIKGGGSYWTGKKFSDAYREKLSLAHLGKNENEQHPNWKGEDASYSTKHQWVQRKKGKADSCGHCFSKNETRYEWANISGSYLRQLDDWISLCKSCHIKYDDVSTKAWATRRLK